MLYDWRDAVKCHPTAVPPADELDIPALKERYRQEGGRRVRPEAPAQYIHLQAEQHKFADAYESDPHMEMVPREPIVEDLDVAILGAGWSGILAGVHLRNAGVENVR